jgi:hypothetical protein
MEDKVMELSELEEALNKQIEKQFDEDCRKARLEFCKVVLPTSVSTVEISIKDIHALVRSHFSEESSKVSANKLIELICTKSWETRKRSLLSKAKATLLGDLKALTTIIRDHYDY